VGRDRQLHSVAGSSLAFPISGVRGQHMIQFSLLPCKVHPPVHRIFESDGRTQDFGRKLTSLGYASSGRDRSMAGKPAVLIGPIMQF
jgi:hypothetical protein